MNLDCEWTYLTGGGIFEIEDLYRFAGNGTRAERAAGHPSYAGCLVSQDLALAPFVNVDFCVWERLELASTTIVVPWPIVPMTSIGRLELDGAERIPNRGNGAPDENGGRVVPRYLPDVEDPAETPHLFLVVVDPSSTCGIRTVDGTILDDPSPWLGSSPAVESGAVEHGDEVGVTIGIGACLRGARSITFRVY